MSWFGLAQHICLDSYAVGLLDPQDVLPVRLCSACREEIYPGEAYRDDITGKVYCQEDCVPVDADMMVVQISEDGGLCDGY